MMDKRRWQILPNTDEEWENELRGFIENCEFSCNGAWDCFHMYVGSKLKSFYSFTKRYTMSSLSLVDYYKQFLYAAVGAPGSSHYARMLKNTRIY